MFNIFKKQVTPKVYAHGLWLFCADCAEKFYLNYNPKLQAAGHLKNPTEDKIFMAESMRLHLWSASQALGVGNRNVLDELHNHARALNLVNSITGEWYVHAAFSSPRIAA